MFSSSAMPSAPIDVRGGPGISVDRAGTATVISAVDVVLPTYGSGPDYLVASKRGDLRLRDGLSLLLRVDRQSVANPTLSIDGSPRAPLLDTSGRALPEGALQPDYLQRVIYDAARGVWIGERFGNFTIPLFDAVARAWWLSLPTDPRGIGPNAPWRNGGIVSWTDASNPAFTIDSAEGRRLTLRLITEALPTSPDGLDPGEPWLNGDAIAFVPYP